MSLSTDQKADVIKKYGKAVSNTGATEVQVALLTERLNQLNQHFSTHSKDHHSKRGLLKLVGQRRRLLNYLNRKDPDGYKKLITDLGIRR